MIHQPHTRGISGQASDILIEAEEILENKKRLAEFWRGIPDKPSKKSWRIRIGIFTSRRKKPKLTD